MTIPNLITAIRILLAPLLVIYLINDEFLPALIVFIIAGISDGADGLVARLFNQKSKIGAYLDPLADKILLVAAFVVLSFRGFVPPWLTVIAISRDFLIILGCLVLFINRADFVVRPSILSKATTCFQLITVFVVLSKDYLNFSSLFSEVIFWLTGILTVSSGLHYMLYWFKNMGEGNNSD
jgi:cardiolipin synthase